MPSNHLNPGRDMPAHSQGRQRSESTGCLESKGTGGSCTSHRSDTGTRCPPPRLFWTGELHRIGVFYGVSRGKSINLVQVLVNKALLQGETWPPEHSRALLSAQQLPVPLSASRAPSFTPPIFHQQQVGPFTLVTARAHPHRCLPILHREAVAARTSHHVLQT